MRRFALAAFLALMSASSAKAQMLRSYFDWDKMPEAEKVGYVMGLTDQYNIHWVGEASKDKAAVDGRVACMNRLQLHASDLIKIIDAAYANPVNRGLTPEFIYTDGVSMTCINDINVERAKYGLSAYTGKPHDIGPGESRVRY